jgi:hypothetical protein
MNLDDAYVEPVVELFTGHIVLRAVYDLVRSLTQAGHAITIGLDTIVRISPPVHENAWYVLDSNWRDVEAILDALDADCPVAVLPQQSAASTTIH